MRLVAVVNDAGVVTIVKVSAVMAAFPPIMAEVLGLTENDVPVAVVVIILAWPVVVSGIMICPAVSVVEAVVVIVALPVGANTLSNAPDAVDDVLLGTLKTT